MNYKVNLVRTSILGMYIVSYNRWLAKRHKLNDNNIARFIMKHIIDSISFRTRMGPEIVGNIIGRR